MRVAAGLPIRCVCLCRDARRVPLPPGVVGLATRRGVGAPEPLVISPPQAHVPPTRYRNSDIDPFAGISPRKLHPNPTNHYSPQHPIGAISVISSVVSSVFRIENKSETCATSTSTSISKYKYTPYPLRVPWPKRKDGRHPSGLLPIPTKCKRSVGLLRIGFIHYAPTWEPSP